MNTIEALNKMNGSYIPTVTDHSHDGGELILETLDPDPQSNLVSVDSTGLRRVGSLKTEEQKEKLRLWEEN